MISDISKKLKRLYHLDIAKIDMAMHQAICLHHRGRSFIGKSLIMEDQIAKILFPIHAIGSYLKNGKLIFKKHSSKPSSLPMEYLRWM